MPYSAKKKRFDFLLVLDKSAVKPYIVQFFHFSPNNNALTSVDLVLEPEGNGQVK